MCADCADGENYVTQTVWELQQNTEKGSILWALANNTKEKTEIRDLPRRRHCLRIPPEDMFFSASISVKLSELAKISTSTRLISLCKNISDASTAKPWDGSMFSNSCCKTCNHHHHYCNCSLHHEHYLQLNLLNALMVTFIITFTFHYHSSCN